MKKYIDDNSLMQAIEYFRRTEYSKPEQIGLFFYFKAAGLNDYSYVEYKKWGDFDASDKERYLRILYDLSGVFDATHEIGQKFTALFPFSITRVYRPNSFYNGGSVFKSLCSRISDTLDNSLISTIIQRDNQNKNGLKFKPNYLSYINDNQLKGNKIPLKMLAAWVYRFWDIDLPDGATEQDFTDIICLSFLLDFHISEKEFNTLFSIDSGTIMPAMRRISIKNFREWLNFTSPDCKPVIEEGKAVDYMPISKDLSRSRCEELLNMRGAVLDRETIISILKERDAQMLLKMKNSEPVEYAWYVGATGTNDEGVYTDFSEIYINENRWENRYNNKYTEIVKTMQVGDRIVIKASYTKKHGLPFNNHGRIVGVMAIKAIGIITKNYGDGKNLAVEWEKVEPNKEWYGDGVLRTTVHCIRAADSYIKKALLKFTFENMQQDYSVFEESDEEENVAMVDESDGATYESTLTLPHRNPKERGGLSLNSILYGAPGTGKTYSTVEYALAIIEGREVDNHQKDSTERKAEMEKYNSYVNSGRIVFTTFHQSYGYEDFIQGLRPDMTGDKMSFVPQDGVFKRIADRAMHDGDNPYVIIIDEINRANISKVFGELITLIEEDKRWGELNAISVTLPSGESFAVPNNLYIVGTMNSADKSISLIDTALRRRFEFIEVVPDYTIIGDSDLKMVLQRINKGLVDELDSTDLLIGHSYFIGKSVNDLCEIMNHSIIPLLYEYFFDNSKKVKDQVKKAIEGLPFDIEDSSIGRLKIIKKA